MKVKIFTTLISFVFISLSLKAQVRQIIIPQEYDGKIDAIEMESRQEVIYIPFTGSTVNLVKVVERYPAANIPYVINILPPDLQGFKDPVIMAMYYKSGLIGSGSLALIISAKIVDQPTHVAFFVDKNMDLNFNNDSKPVLLKMGSKNRKVIMSPKNGADHKIYLSVDNPLIDENTKRLIDKNERKKIRNQLGIGFKAGFGVGKLNFDFQNLTTGYPTWYSVNYIEKNVGVSLSYNFSKVILGLGATYQNMFFYTSYLNIRTREDRRVWVAGLIKTFPGIDVLRNNDIHERNQLQLKGSLAYRLSIGRTVEIQPTIAAGSTSFLSGEYIGDQRGDQKKYPLRNTSFYEFGLNFEFTVGRKRTLYLGGMYNQLFWKPEGYFEEVPHENLNNSGFRTFVTSIGYRMGL